METLAAMVSAIIATIAAFAAAFSWHLKRREEQLRRDDVLIWARDAIDALQSILLVCRLGGTKIEEDVACDRMLNLLFRTSILVEQGRLFFKNVPKGDFGGDKPEAYRGLRPLMLDHLVMGHEIACNWPMSNISDRKKMGYLAENAARSFVSAVRGEVGRDRSATDGASKEGYGVRFNYEMQQITADDLRSAHWL